MKERRATTTVTVAAARTAAKKIEREHCVTHPSYRMYTRVKVARKEEEEKGSLLHCSSNSIQRRIVKAAGGKRQRLAASLAGKTRLFILTDIE